MTYYDDYLKHHGVKGMKWGVRRYKDARKEGKKAQREYEKYGDKAYNYAKKSVKQYDRESNALRLGKTKAAKTAEAKNIAYTKQSDEYAAKAAKARQRYERAVSKAANEKIYIKRRDTLANAKKYGKKAVAGTVALNGIASLTGDAAASIAGGIAAGYVAPARKTRNDRFAEDVDKKQKSKRK